MAGHAGAGPGEIKCLAEKIYKIVVESDGRPVQLADLNRTELKKCIGLDGQNLCEDDWKEAMSQVSRMPGIKNEGSNGSCKLVYVGAPEKSKTSPERRAAEVSNEVRILKVEEVTDDLRRKLAGSLTELVREFTPVEKTEALRVVAKEAGCDEIETLAWMKILGTAVSKKGHIPGVRVDGDEYYWYEGSAPSKVESAFEENQHAAAEKTYPARQRPWMVEVSGFKVTLDGNPIKLQGSMYIEAELEGGGRIEGPVNNLVIRFD